MNFGAKVLQISGITKFLYIFLEYHVTNSVILRIKGKQVMMTQEEFKQQVVRIRPHLMIIAKRYLEDADEAEDTVQDVLLQLWQMIDTLRIPFDSLAGILVRNRCIDKVRRQKSVVRMEQLTDVCEEDVDQDLLERTMRLVETLPDMQQTIIRLRHMEGMRMSEIAQLTGSTEVAVRKTLSRARKTLAERFRSLEG